MLANDNLSVKFYALKKAKKYKTALKYINSP